MSEFNVLEQVGIMLAASGPMRRVANAAKEGTGIILTVEEAIALNNGHEAMGELMGKAADIIERFHQ